MTSTLPPRFDVTRADIETVVAFFYDQVRKHPTLGPIFAKSIPHQPTAWPEHEAKIVRFWSNAILHEKGYSGNPMAMHMATPHIHENHFPIWLDLFEFSLRETLKPHQADSFNAFARRIGRGLQMGLSFRDTPNDHPPKLR